MDRKGAIQALPFQGKQFFNPRLSPDGRGIAVGVSAANDQIWVGDLSRGTMVRLTFEPQNSDAPVWTPDGKRIIYSQDDGKSMNIYWRPADGSGQPERLTNSPNRQTAVSVSRDGRWMAFVEQDPKTGNDIWVMPLSGGGKPVPFVRTPFNEVHPGFSPDGRWMVYASNETGRMEVYAAPFPGPGGRIPISNDGGEMPKWSNDEKEIIYFRTGRFYRVPVKLQPKLEVGKAEFLFEAPWFSAYTSFQMVLNYDLMPDGRHLLMSKSQSQAGTIQELQIVLNWFEELKRMAPAGGNAAK
ncbi:MAG: PD40 domain-containing protein [Acidobacteria bacterium]|nr:PD40 domain-containing protein [Acidobacteriota bacterium]